MVAGFLTASLIIYWQRSDDRAALLFSALLMTVGVTNGVINYVPEPSAGLKGFEILSDFLSLLVLFTFPDGSLVPRWASWVLATWLLYLFATSSICSLEGHRGSLRPRLPRR